MMLSCLFCYQIVHLRRTLIKPHNFYYFSHWPHLKSQLKVWSVWINKFDYSQADPSFAVYLGKIPGTPEIGANVVRAHERFFSIHTHVGGEMNKQTNELTNGWINK